MGYQVLARKYRPQKFKEVVGQEAVIQTLKNALKMDRVASAYVFSGSRGVGKTTTARLFAKALNCTQRQEDLEPCGTCPSCQEITSGQSLDVLEIDGASNRGIDDIRQINETAPFAPSHGRFKIYLIDEVHMLTKEAFNALLKTLEEPPAHVKFFFATTEPHKILPTILSRCQRFDLGRLLPEQIAPKLQSICEELKREVETDAIDLLARFADGSLRDAESLLDQILCFSNGQIAEKHVRDALGLVPQELLFNLDNAFEENRLGFAFEAVEAIFHAGKDLSHFLQQAIEHYRLITLVKTARSPQSLKLPSGYSKASESYTQSQALAILDLLVKAEAVFSKNFSQRSALEITLLQLLRLKNRIPVEALVRRLSELEDKWKEESAPSSSIPPETLHQNNLKNQELEKKDPQNFEENLAAPKNDASSDFSIERLEPVEQASSKGANLTLDKTPLVEKTPQLEKVPFSPLEKPAIFHPASTQNSPPIQNEFFAPTPIAAPSAPAPITPKTAENFPSQSKHSSHYDTLVRFAAVELEGTIKNS